MKLFAACCVLLFCLSAKAQKERYSQAPPVPTAANTLKFHLSHSYLGHGSGLYLEGILAGQKVELFNSTWSGGLLAPGDYSVVLSGNETFKDGSVRRTYNIFLADGKGSFFTLNGLSE